MSSEPHFSASPVPTAAPGFTRAEQAALWRLRACYVAGRDLLSLRELERLRVIRWLYQPADLPL
jgi:hypothetical protein